MTSIRRRLLLTLALPVLGLTVLSGINVRDAQRRSDHVRAEVSIALAAGGPSTFITALMDERNITSIELLGLEGDVQLRVENSREAIGISDQHLAELRRSLVDVAVGTRLDYEAALDSIETGLQRLRQSAQGYKGPRDLENVFTDQIYTGYTGLIGELHTLNDVVISRINDADLRNKARAIANLSLTSDRQSQMTRFVLLATLGQGNLEQIKSEASQMVALWASEADEAVELMASDPERQAIVKGFYERPNQLRLEQAMGEFVLTGAGDPTLIITEAGDPAAPNGAQAWEAARASINDRAEVMTDRTGVQRRNAVAWLVLSVVGSLVVALAAARSLARPLHRLADHARTVAGRQLPDAVKAVLDAPRGEPVIPELEPVAPSGIKEVDEIAEALNGVQNRALELAAGQATARRNSSDSLVNVARRVQGLVGRQIELIDRVDAHENDPGRLESVQTLEHLASRIRRNTESLVVLAGSGGRVRLNSGPPVPVADVMRCAVDEVEQPERVRINSSVPMLVSGRCSTDLTHLLAELVENSLSFSPPRTDVIIDAYPVADAYRITIVDEGIGMADEALEEANQRLAGRVPFGDDVTKYLGHHVIGTLAAQHDITVRLATTTEGGVAATITLPAELLATAEGRDGGSLDLTGDGPEDPAAPTQSLHDLALARRSLDTIVR